MANGFTYPYANPTGPAPAAYSITIPFSTSILDRIEALERRIQFLEVFHARGKTKVGHFELDEGMAKRGR